MTNRRSTPAGFLKGENVRDAGGVNCENHTRAKDSKSFPREAADQKLTAHPLKSEKSLPFFVGSVRFSFKFPPPKKNNASSRRSEISFQPVHIKKKQRFPLHSCSNQHLPRKRLVSPQHSMTLPPNSHLDLYLPKNRAQQ